MNKIQTLICATLLAFAFTGCNRHKAENMNYQNYLDRYTTIAAHYTNTRNTIGSLSESVGSIASADKIRALFSSYADEDSKSASDGTNKLLLDSNVFVNMELASCETGNQELIVADSSKYNLIVFSASWCGPCHRLIPVLKSIYQDLNKDLIITYVSVDDVYTSDTWKQLMKKEEIPWRSLMSKDKQKEVHVRYGIRTIPLIILVAPDMTMEVLDVRDQTNKDKLYAFVKK